MPARVLIVDDSLTMRALFSGVLERARGIEVVGMAADAAEARDMIGRLNPDVITLDVEMPGMSGLDFLEEIMRERPMPVIMLSTLTQKGAETSLRALELGAVECFPKPTSATMEEFNALAPKLAALVLAASSGQVKRDKPAPVATAPQPDFQWNGNLVAMSASLGGVDALLTILPSLPANCPPTVVLLQIDQGLVDPLVKRLQASCKAQVRLAADEQLLGQGTVTLVTDPATHAVVARWPDPMLRLLPSDPVNGARPSASLLFATIAKTAGANGVGVVLTGMGHDGAAGLKALRAAGGRTFAQDAASSVVAEAPAAAVAVGAVERELPLGAIVPALLDACRGLTAAVA